VAVPRQINPPAHSLCMEKINPLMVSTTSKRKLSQPSTSALIHNDQMILLSIYTRLSLNRAVSMCSAAQPITSCNPKCTTALIIRDNAPATVKLSPLASVSTIRVHVRTVTPQCSSFQAISRASSSRQHHCRLVESECFFSCYS